MGETQSGDDASRCPGDADGLQRREFLKLGGIAGLAAGSVLAPSGAVAQGAQPTTAKAVPSAAVEKGFPVIDVSPLAKIEVGKEIAFNYPEDSSPAVLIRLPRAAEGGVGPDKSIVAFSVLCTHKGCPVTFKADRGILLCGCHWSSFDPAMGGRMIIGQASEPLPQIALRVTGDMVQAIGVNGLIYGRHTNIK